MGYFEEGSIIAEVRKNRAELLAEFNGDMKKFAEFIIFRRSAMESVGWRYETKDELEARKAFHGQTHRAELDRIESLNT